MKATPKAPSRVSRRVARSESLSMGPVHTPAGEIGRLFSLAVDQFEAAAKAVQASADGERLDHGPFAVLAWNNLAHARGLVLDMLLALADDVTEHNATDREMESHDHRGVIYGDKLYIAATDPSHWVEGDPEEGQEKGVARMYLFVIPLANVLDLEAVDFGTEVGP